MPSHLSGTIFPVLSVVAVHPVDRIGHKPRVSPVQGVRRHGAVEGAVSALPAEDAPRKFSPEQRAHGNAGETITNSVMDALMAADVRIEIESSAALASPHMVEAEIGQFRKDS